MATIPKLKIKGMKGIKAEPFTAAEDARLMSLVMKFKHIIECKQTDHQNNLKKQETWQNIERLFNQDQEGLPHRTHASLKVRYTNKKTRGKKDLADKKMRSFFSPEETRKLVEILEELQTTNLTDALWEEIVQNFNAEEFSLQRTRSELEQLYKQITSETKKKMKIEGKSVTDTGGGRYIHMQYSQEEEQLTALLKNRIEGDGAIYDNDNDQFQDASLHGYAEQNVDDFEGSYEVETITMGTDDENDIFENSNANLQSVPGSSRTDDVRVKRTDSVFSNIDRNVPTVNAIVHREANETEQNLDHTTCQRNTTAHIKTYKSTHSNTAAGNMRPNIKKPMFNAIDGNNPQAILDQSTTTEINTIALLKAPKSACSIIATENVRQKKKKPVFSAVDENTPQAISNQSTIWEKNTTALLKTPKSACLSIASETSEDTKRKREYKTNMSEWAKSKIELNTLQYNDVQESILKRKVREDEEYKSKKQKADELHSIKVETETKLGELQVKEMELRIQHEIKKQELELEILNLSKSIKQKELGLIEKK